MVKNVLETFSFNSARELEINVDVAELKASSCIKERDLNAREGKTTLSHARRVRDVRFLRLKNKGKQTSESELLNEEHSEITQRKKASD